MAGRVRATSSEYRRERHRDEGMIKMVRFDDLVLPESANARPGRLDPDTVDILEALAREVREEQAEKADAHNMSRRQFMEATCLASLAAPGALQSALAGEGDGTIPKKNNGLS